MTASGFTHPHPGFIFDWGDIILGSMIEAVRHKAKEPIVVVPPRKTA